MEDPDILQPVSAQRTKAHYRSLLISSSSVFYSPFPPKLSTPKTMTFSPSSRLMTVPYPSSKYTLNIPGGGMSLLSPTYIYSHPTAKNPCPAKNSCLSSSTNATQMVTPLHPSTTSLRTAFPSSSWSTPLAS